MGQRWSLQTHPSLFSSCLFPNLLPLSLSLSNACGEVCTVQFGNHLSCFEGAILALHADDDWMMADQFPGSYRHRVEATFTRNGSERENSSSHRWLILPLASTNMSIYSVPFYTNPYMTATYVSLHLPASFNQSKLGWFNLDHLQHVLWETYLFVNCTQNFWPILCLHCKRPVSITMCDDGVDTTLSLLLQSCPCISIRWAEKEQTNFVWIFLDLICVVTFPSTLTHAFNTLAIDTLHAVSESEVG